MLRIKSDQISKEVGEKDRTVNGVERSTFNGVEAEKSRSTSRVLE